MIQLILKTVPDRYTFFYHLVFTPDTDGMITHFCHSVEGELILPLDENDEPDLTAADCLNRLVFIETKNEKVKDARGKETDDERASVKAILKRVKALAKAPHLAKLLLVPNVPPPKTLPVVRAGSLGALAESRRNGGGGLDLDAEPDDLPF